MGYKVRQFDLTDLNGMIRNYPYVLLYNISSLELCKNEGRNIDLSQAVEARFFGPDSELHVLFEEGKAILVEDDGPDNVLARMYKLSDKYRELGTSIKVRHYLEEDEDGQNVIVLTRLENIF